MNRERWLATERTIVIARTIAEHLKELSVEDLENTISDRERYQESESFAKMADERAKQAGIDLTETLRIILRFRQEIITAQPTAEDQARAVEHARKYFADHPDRIPPGHSIAEFLEGAR